MTASRILVRRLTSSTVRWARQRASARTAPIRTFLPPPSRESPTPLAYHAYGPQLIITGITRPRCGRGRSICHGTGTGGTAHLKQRERAGGLRRPGRLGWVAGAGGSGIGAEVCGASHTHYPTSQASADAIEAGVSTSAAH